MKRTLLTVAIIMAALAADADAAEAGLTVGPELAIGVPRLGTWPGHDARPVLASDGDRVLVAYAGGPVNQQRFAYAMLLDREGRPFLPAPLFLGAANGQEMHALWVNGAFLVFFSDSFAGSRVVRISRDGEILQTPRTVLPVPVDVATNGEEIVLLTWNKLLRLRSDLTMIETLDLGLTHGSASAVAWGDGRFAIVVIQGTRIWSQFLQRDGLREWATLTPPVRIADVGDGEKGADLVWTASRFVVAWSECLDRTCIGMWTPLTGAGAAAGPAIATDYVYWELFELPLAITGLDDETLFVHWPAAQGEKAHGRRYRDGAPLDVKPLELGKGVAASLLTAHGLLFTVDAALRISVTPAPATAPLSEPMPLVLTAANEHVLGAAATESEIAIVRTSYRTMWPDGDAVLTVMARDGRLVREVVLEAFFAAIASDGRDFALLTVDRDFGMWFQPRGAAGRRVRVGAGSYPSGIHLVWNGSEFVALWHEQAGIRMQRIGADGKLLDGAHPIEGVEGHDPRLTVAGEELLLGWSASNSGLMMAMRLTNSGEPAGAPEVLTANGAQLAVASNGRTDLAAAYGLAAGPSAIRVAVREKGSPFTALPSMLPPEAERSGREPVLAAAGSLFVALFDSVGRDRPYAPRTEAALIDERGMILDSEIVAAGDSPYGASWPYQASKALVPLGNGALLAVYSRMTPEAPYGGMWATFARVLVLSHGRRRAVGR